MILADFAGKRVGVLGLGVNNRELAVYLLRQGIPLVVRDRDAEVQAKFAVEHPDLAPYVEWQIVPDILADLNGFDVLFRSPSIPYHHPQLQRAIKKGALVTSQTRLFFDLCPATIIGVTGTKGKGTTTELLFGMLSAWYTGGKVYRAGNIGQDPFAYLPALTATDYVILELSSYQLEDMSVSPPIAILLNVAVDHLDHHRTMAEYRDAKRNLIAHQKEGDLAVVFADRPETAQLARSAQGRVITYRVHTPQRQSAWVAEVDGDEVLYLQLDETLESFSIGARKLLGTHNLENIIPAAIVATVLGVPPATVREVIISYRGLPHRLQYVGKYAGVDVFNDSMATTPEAAGAALNALKGRRVHLIAGGKDKGVDYGPMVAQMATQAVSVSLLPGSGTERFRRTLLSEAKKSGCQVLANAREPIFATILSGIQPHLSEGDAILLAPGCASDIPFKDYKERGEAYLAAIQERYQAEVHP